MLQEHLESSTKFTFLFTMVRDLAHKHLQEKRIELLRNLSSFARENDAIPTLDTSIYAITYNAKLKDFIVSQLGSNFSPNIIYFNNKDVVYKAIETYKDDLDKIVYLADIVGRMGYKIPSEEYSPYTRSELISIYYKLSEDK